MSELDQLFRAQKESEAACNLYNYAGQKLQLAKIKERLAFLRSQHEPLASFIQDKGITRDEALSIAEYVLFDKPLTNGRKTDGHLKMKEANE